MKVKLRWSLVAAAGAALLGPVAGLVPAQAATSTWRVVQVFGDTALNSVAATAAGNAVAAEVHCTNRS
ncbi:MAG TPA: hypothetical protein VGS19_10735 [Streptosporangiaceae bacterium]|nr:hypothetical protein [Streptosporangiaceae bacterium]